MCILKVARKQDGYQRKPRSCLSDPRSAHRQLYNHFCLFANNGTVDGDKIPAILLESDECADEKLAKVATERVLPRGLCTSHVTFEQMVKIVEILHTNTGNVLDVEPISNPTIVTPPLSWPFTIRRCVCRMLDFKSLRTTSRLVIANSLITTSILVSVACIAIVFLNKEMTISARTFLVHNRMLVTEALSSFSDDMLDGSKERAIRYIDKYNAQLNHTSMEVVLATRTKDIPYTQLHDRRQIQFLTRFKRPCAGKQCFHDTSSGLPMLLALQGKTGEVVARDYRNVDVEAAYAYIPSLDIGLVVKLDRVEMLEPGYVVAFKLIGICMGFLVLFMVCNVLLSRWTISAMRVQWKSANEALQHEKKLFEGLVGAMYPQSVARRLLEGDIRIVQDVPSCAVFFSDIFQFTALSNEMSSQELVEFTSYIFGVMDTVADYAKVYKIKTIGDAYLAVAGLPDDEHNQSENCCVIMVRFAVYCAQIFGHWFEHPKRCMRGKTNLESPTEGCDRSEQSACSTRSTTPITPQKAQCAMRYGIAMGPLVAGVLQLKTPAFDIWGRTVNLASRMESTGVPGRVQVTESVYEAVTNCTNVYTFEGPNMVYAKGFGNVCTFLVKDTPQPPPSNLLSSLSLVPCYGLFSFVESPTRHTKKGMPRSLASCVKDGAHCLPTSL